MVDGFRFQNANCKSYLLTHFHSDHTTGLTRGFTAGLIYCTPVTARYATHPTHCSLNRKHSQPSAYMTGPEDSDREMRDGSGWEQRRSPRGKGCRRALLPG